MNNENACVPMAGENALTESVATVLGDTKGYLDETMDIGMRIMNLLGASVSAAPNLTIENLFDSAKNNRDEASELRRLMTIIAETLGC